MKNWGKFFLRIHLCSLLSVSAFASNVDLGLSEWLPRKFLKVTDSFVRIESRKGQRDSCELLNDRDSIVVKKNRKILVTLPSNENSKCGSDFKSELQKQIVFALFAVYDENQISATIDLEECTGSMRPSNSKQRKAKCIRLRKQNARKGHISDDIVFSQLAKLHGRVGIDDFSLRSLDPEEKTSNQSFAKYNFHAFLTDNEYKCRRPAINAFFEKHFSHVPFPQKKCNLRTVIVSDQGSSLFQELPFDRVYQIDYLVASKGESPMSWFGHSMFRLVVCAPESLDPITGKTLPATKFGPDCLNDLSHHIVVNFAAYLGDAEVDVWKGISGGYMSTMYLSSLKDVQQKYNIVESRNLDAYPMKFTEAQKYSFLNSLVENYWDYSGTYRFFSNNCATEAFFMASGVMENPQFSLQEPSTPKAVLESFMDWGLISNSSENPPVHFKAKRNLVEQIKDKISTLSPRFAESLVDYQSLDIDQRRSYVEGLESSSGNALMLENLRSQYSVLLVYEKQVQLKEYLEVAGEIYTSFLKDLELNDFQYLNVLKYPKTMLETSYGVPEQEDLYALRDAMQNIKNDPVYVEAKANYEIKEKELKRLKKLQKELLKKIIINRKKLGGLL